MSDAQKKLEKANDTADDMNVRIDFAINNLSVVKRRLKAIVDPQLTAKVREFLLANYNAVGIKTKTGKLKGALSKSTAALVFGKHPRIKIWMAAEVEDYDGGSGFYTVAASINYGAVHSPKEKVKRKDKAALKKKVHKAQEKKNFGNKAVIGGGFVLEGGEKTKAGSATFGGGNMWVTKPHDYWSMSENQQQVLINIVEGAFQRLIGETFK